MAPLQRASGSDLLLLSFFKPDHSPAAPNTPAQLRYCQCDARMDGLPLELVAAIFRKLGLKDCITVCHVCRRWRNASVGDPLLWTRLVVDMTPIEGVETLVLRSRELPLYLSTAALIQGEEERLAKVLAQNMARIYSLCFQTTLRCWTDSVRDALCTPAPVMVGFEMHALNDGLEENGDEDIDVTLPPLLFGGLAPCLIQLELHDVYLPSTCLALSNVRLLSVELPETPPDETLCLSDVLPDLLGLTIANQQHEPHFSLKPGHRLFSLDMTARWGLLVDLCEPLRAVNHANSLSLTANTTDADTLVLVFGSTLGVSELSLGITDPTMDERWDTRAPIVDVSFSGPAQIRRFPIVELSTVSELLANPARLATVVSFNVAHHLLHLAPALLPGMKHLYVEFPDEDEPMEYDLLVLWLDSRRTPLLETLTLSGVWQASVGLGHRPLTRPRVLSAARLAACLKIKAPPLRELRLCAQMEEVPDAVTSLLGPAVGLFSHSSQQ
ncbi:hypothetical protein AURDEDRAFT_122657 [Auricularia subglabra TFB-10046 SS5]|nr:hypothetical protein AURDEDRAFT_122657 [Auricularia subglabra TFB-10046 SS5]